MNSYLKAIFTGVTEGTLVVWHKATKGTRCFPITQMDEADHYMLSTAQTDDVYFGWGLQEYPPVWGRGKSATVSVVGGLMMDIDLRSGEPGVHSKNDHLPGSLDDVLAFLHAAGIPGPTALRHSGNGLYADWLFDQAAILRTNQERATVQDLSRRLQRAVIALALKLKGWKLDSTHDLARVTRLPGTLNHKTAIPKPVSLISMDESKRYPLAALKEALEALEKAHGLTGKAEKKKPVGRRTPANDNDPDQDTGRTSFDAIVEGCAWTEWCNHNAENLPEPAWYALASIVGPCADGRSRFHEISKADPRYDHSEADAKLDHALASAGPRTCTNIADELAFEGCKRCPFYGRITSPILLGRTDAAIVRLMRDHAFDISTGRFVELDTLRVLSEKAFSDKFRHLTGDSLPSKRLIAHRFTRKLDRLDYLPGVPESFATNETGETVVNLWRPSPVVEQEGDCGIITDHLAYIYPERPELNHVLDCLAHVVQKPHEKIKHVLLTIGVQGTGKSLIGAIIREIVGHQNMWIVESHDLTDGWTAKMGNRQVLSLEELGIFEKRETYERLKRWCTEEVVEVNEKHVPKYSARTPRFMLAFSNHEIPTALQVGDRRWWVSRSPAVPNEPDYYKRLAEEGLKQVPAFVHFLRNRDISQFRPAAPPPMTPAKMDIMGWSRSAVEQEIEIMMAQGTHPFGKDLVLAEKVREEVANRHKGRWPALREVTSALKALGAVQVRQVRYHQSERIRPWAWRHVEFWTQASPDDIRRGLQPMSLAG